MIILDQYCNEMKVLVKNNLPINTYQSMFRASWSETEGSYIYTLILHDYINKK